MMAISGNGKRALVKRSDGMVVVDTSHGDPEEVSLEVTGHISAAELDYTGSYAAIAHDQSLSIFDTSSGNVATSLRLRNGPLQRLAFSSDGLTIAGAGKQATGIWLWQESREISSKTRIFDPNDPSMYRAISFASERGLENESKSQMISSLAVADRGEYLAVGTRTGFLHLWTRGEEGKPDKIVTADAHNGIIYQTRFHPDGDSVISAGAAAIKLWALNGNQLAEFSSHHAEVTDLKFSQDGMFAVSTGKDRAVRVWATHWKEWLNIGCERLSYHRISHSGKQRKTDHVEAEAKAVCSRHTRYQFDSAEHLKLRKSGGIFTRIREFTREANAS